MNINALFDLFGRASEFACLKDAERRKVEQIDSVTTKRCGNCDHWMKTTCAPEKVHGQFKSCADIACGAFVRGHSSVRLENQFNSELAEIRVKLEPFMASR